MDGVVLYTAIGRVGLVTMMTEAGRCQLQKPLLTMPSFIMSPGALGKHNARILLTLHSHHSSASSSSSVCLIMLPRFDNASM